MRVEEYIRKNVVFVGVEAAGRFIPLGTGCLGGVDIDDFTFMFLVTAAHVVDAINGDMISVRLNRKIGDCATFTIPKSYRLVHADRANDLALFPMLARPDVYDFTLIPLIAEELSEAREKFPPGLGDEVAIVGLYTSHYGEEKNIPIVRIGHLAMLPDEPVMTSAGYVSAYLIETKSIGRLSGSPVYLNVPRLRVSEGKIQYLTVPYFMFLGILVGYHLVESREDQIAVPRFQPGRVAAPAAAGESADERNTGFSVVIPYDRILEILQTEAVMNSLREIARAPMEGGGYQQASQEDLRGLMRPEDDAS
jgi:hypothetical protein